MSQPSSGPINLESQLDEILDEYDRQKQVKTPFKADFEDIDEYINMDRGTIEALDRDDRISISLRLAQYTLYIQRLLNREKARVSFCDAAIRNSCAKEWESYDSYTKYDMKISLIARNNDFIKKVIRLRNHAELRVIDLEGMTPILKHMSDLLMRSTYGKE